MNRITKKLTSGVLALGMGLGTATAAPFEDFQPANLLSWFRVFTGQQTEGDVERTLGPRARLTPHAEAAAGAREVQIRSQQERDVVEYGGRLREIGNRAAAAAVRQSQRDVLEAYRQQFRLRTPKALAAARQIAIDPSRDPYASVSSAAGRIYAAAEKKARYAAFEAGQIHWKKTYAIAKARVARLSKEFEDRVLEEVRVALNKEFLKNLRELLPKLGYLAAHRKAKELTAEAEERFLRLAAAEIKAYRAEVEAREMAEADRKADEHALEVYAELEQDAWETAEASLEQEPERRPALPEAPVEEEPAQDGWMTSAADSAPSLLGQGAE